MFVMLGLVLVLVLVSVLVLLLEVVSLFLVVICAIVGIDLGVVGVGMFIDDNLLTWVKGWYCGSSGTWWWRCRWWFCRLVIAFV